MRNLSIFYLLFIMLLKMAAMPIAFLDYSANRNFIAGTLCENKGKPKMNCFGKCYLKKQLANSNDSQESQDQKSSSKNQIIDFFEPANNQSFHFSANGNGHSSAFRKLSISSPFVASIFHPPIA